MPDQIAAGQPRDPLLLQGAAQLRRLFPLLAQLSAAGHPRDKSHNRRLQYSQYAALILIGLFNPALNSARALVAASGLKSVRKLTGGGKVSLGAFSEAARVFDPQLLEGLVRELKRQWQRHAHPQGEPSRSKGLSNALLERLVAVDASVLTALPQLVGRLRDPRRGQWRLHAHVRVFEGSVLRADLTREPSQKETSERGVLLQSLEREGFDSSGEAPALYLLDRGYRSAEVFNRIHHSGRDYVCRLNRTDGRVSPRQDALPALPPLSEEARTQGIVADEWIVLGGGSGASPTRTDHPVRRITLRPPPCRPSSARQGRVRRDQSGREELILATTLGDLPAEQIVALYEYRWQVELFFRFLKHVLGCKQLLSTKTPGVQIQLYCALIASLLLALLTGRAVTRRNYEMVCLYLQGWADEEELLAALSIPPPNNRKQ